MTAIDRKLAEIAGRADAAPLGPWIPTDEPNDKCCWTHHVERHPSNPIYEGQVDPVADVDGEPAAKFIALARTDVPALLRLVAVLREQRDKYRRLIDEANDGREVDIAVECNWTEQDDAAALAALEGE